MIMVIVVMVAQLHTFTKNHCIVHFREQNNNDNKRMYNLFIHSTVDKHLGSFQFGTIIILLMWTCLYMSLGRHMYTFLLGVYPTVEFWITGYEYMYL